MTLAALTLRRRLLLAFIAAVALIGVVALIVGVQFVLTFTGAVRLQERLTPATEMADGLITAQAAASGDLSDYVLTGRQRALDSYLASVAAADAAIRSLETTLEEDASLEGLLVAVSAAQQTWLDDDAEPTLRAMQEGDRAKAARVTNRPRAWQSFDRMIASSTELRDDIAALRAQARSSTDSFARQLGLWLALLAGALLIVTATAFVVMNAWVIRPLLSIRRDIARAATSQHTHPISAVGPPELQAVALDAENLRRSLVAEIDEVRAARTGLAQAAPLAIELEAAFARSTVPVVAGLSLAGTTSTAEGVVSGDWWDMFVLDDDRFAVVVGDTSGHGTAATLTALRVRDLVRAALASGDSVERAVRVSATSFDQDRNFVTMFVAVIAPQARSMAYVNAGHQPALIVTPDKQVLRCQITGPLLSALGGEWIQETVRFDVGSVFLAYTDGLTEGHGPAGADLEVDDLARVIKAMDAPIRTDAPEVLARVVSSVRERSGNWYRDDMTAVTVGHVGMAL
jgi:serine phosphatase RsbU (regulator of sigma subunit)/CHASE3 domain sensor protein